MKFPHILSQSICSLLAFGALVNGAQAAVTIWDGGTGGTGTDLGTAVNWSGDALPVTGDTAQWNGTVSGNLALVLNNSGALNTTNGIFLDVTAAQTGSLQIDNVTTNTSNAIRLQNITIASGAGAFTLGDGNGTSFITLGSGTVTSNTWTNNSANAATISSDVIWADGGGVANRLLTLTGSGNWNMNAVYGVTVAGGSGTLALSKQGTGTLTLSAANTYTGPTTLGTANVTAGGVLRVDNNGALGTSVLTINGGTANDRLEIVNGRALNNAITLSGRQGTAITAPHITSATGSNTLSGTITFTTGGSNYTIQSDAGSTLTLSNATAVTAGTTTGPRILTLQGAGNGVVSGAIINGTAALQITKAGTGTWTFTGANAYSGATAVNAGTLITTPAQTAATTVTVADGATFGVKLAAAGTTFNVGSLTTGTTSGATLLFDTSAFGNPTAPVINTGTFTPTGSTVLRVTGSALTLGSNIPLIDYTGTIGGLGLNGLSVALPARTVGNLVDNTTDTRIDLNITQFEQIKWKGNVNGTWDADIDGTGTNGTQNWVTTVNQTPTKYLQGTAGTDTVNFDDSASGNTTINLAVAVTPVGINFNNSTKSYTISSTGGFGIGGTGVLAKSGTGSVTLTTANTYSGGTLLNAGKLNVNHASALGTGTVTINGGTLDNTSGSAITLTTNNAQTWNGDFTFSGSSDLDMGIGIVTAGGTGTDRTVTVSAGTLTVGKLKSAAGGLNKQGAGTLAIGSVGTDVTSSVIAGTLNVGAGTLQINRTGAVGVSSGDFTAGGLTGSGTVTNGAGTERWLFVNSTGSFDFAGTLANGGSAALGFNKQGTGTQTLSGTNSYTGATTLGGGTLILKGTNTGAGTAATLNAGNLVLANTSALGASSLIRIAGANVATLTFATDGGDTTYAFTQGTTTNSTIVSDRATPGAGINHTLTTQLGANGVGGGSITFTSGANVTSGKGQITIPYFGLGAGSVQTTTLIPTTANVSVGDISKANNNFSQTIELAGTSDGNEVTGSISNGSPIASPNAISLIKSGTSKWTLSGNSTYTGATTISGGTLLVQGSISGTTGVAVTAGTLGGSGSIASAVTVGDSVGTQDAILAPGVGIGTLSNTGGITFQSDAVFALEINSTARTTDLLTSTGAVSLGLGIATLNVSDLGNTKISTGQTFTFLSSTAGVSGQFAGLPDGLVFGVGSNFYEINYTPTTVELIATVPEPASATLLLAGGALLGFRRVRRRTV